ncbi:hypothetical protein JCM3770_003099 [Rhodotorula araucariae]
MEAELSGPGNPAMTDYPTMSAPQHTATIVMGSCSAGYQAQLLLAGLFFALFATYWSSGELQAHNKWSRIALCVSLFLNAVYTGVVFYEGLDAAISQNRTFFYIANGNTTWNTLSLLNGLIAGLTEGYLATRAGVLIPSRKMRYAFWLWMACLIALVLAGSAMASATGYLYLFGRADSDLAIGYNTAAALWLYASAAADLSISAACGYALRSRIAGFNKTTDSLLRRLTFIALRTAAYTTIVSFAGAIMLSIYSDDDLLGYVSTSMWLPMPGLYGLSLFTFSASSRRAIDSRLGPSSVPTAHVPAGGGVYIRRSVHAFDSNGVPLSRLPVSPSSDRSERGNGVRRAVPLQIIVQTHSVVEYDEPDLEACMAGSAREKTTGPVEEWEKPHEWRGKRSWEG